MKKQFPDALFLYALNEDGTLLHGRFLDPKENPMAALSRYMDEIESRYGWKKSPNIYPLFLKNKDERRVFKNFLKCSELMGGNVHDLISLLFLNGLKDGIEFAKIRNTK